MTITRTYHLQHNAPVNDDEHAIHIVTLDATLVDLCQAEYAQMGWSKPDGYFAECLAQQDRDEMVFYVALGAEHHYVGHAKLIWRPDYPHFRQHGIPEIQDLNVLPAYRKRGIATHLIQCCEATAAMRCERTGCAEIGIGVGLHPGYNAAQRLYSKLGYILDGHGVHYGDVPVKERQTYLFDDDLIIYFTKVLKKPASNLKDPG